MKQNWQAYSSQLQSVLESAYRDCPAKLDHGACGLRCAQGHPMVIAKRWNHECNLCEKTSTEYRCSESCDYDLCKQCGATIEEESEAASKPIPGSLASDTCKALLCQGVSALAALRSLSENHGFRFSQEDIRHALLARGSPTLLKEMLCSEPQVQLLGMDIFDKRYPGLVLNEGVRACIRILLSRGAKLGSFAPASKLLRKVEADELEAWTARYLTSMSCAQMDLPDHVRQLILNFLRRS